MPQEANRKPSLCMPQRCEGEAKGPPVSQPTGLQATGVQIWPHFLHGSLPWPPPLQSSLLTKSTMALPDWAQFLLQ